MCGLQSYISLVLFSSRVHKKVCKHVYNSHNQGDSVDKQKGVRDISSDNHGELKHMFSLIAVKARVTPPFLVPDFVPVSLSSLEVSHFLPTKVDVEVTQKNLVVLVSQILCDYIQAFCPQKTFGSQTYPSLTQQGDGQDIRGCCGGRSAQE